MKRYGQFCPVAKAAEVFCARWTPLILRDLAGGATRFSELQRGVPLASPTILSRRLKELEEEGIVERRSTGRGRTRSYHLTPAGEEFVPVVMALGTWGQRWSRRDLRPDEMDFDLLIWALEKGANPDAFGGRALVELTVTDQPAHKRCWWFLNESGHCELCIENPGFEVDLWVAADTATLIQVWRGDVGLPRARDAGDLEAHGAREALAALGDWFAINPLADVASQRSAAAG